MKDQAVETFRGDEYGNNWFTGISPITWMYKAGFMGLSDGCTRWKKLHKRIVTMCYRNNKWRNSFPRPVDLPPVFLLLHNVQGRQIPC